MRASATRIFQPPDSVPTSPATCSAREAEAGEDGLRARLELVAADLLKAGLHLAVAVDDRVEVVAGRPPCAPRAVQLLAERGHLAGAGQVSASTLRPCRSPTSWRK